MEKVTLGIVNYNGSATIVETLKSIETLNYPDFEVIVADNCSTDGSREFLQQYYPKVKCLCLESNQGSSGARQALLEASNTDYIFFLDNDISLEPDCLSALMQVMQNVPNAAACHPDIQDVNDPVAYHYNGGFIHYLCVFISREAPREERSAYEVFDVVSGGSLLVDRQAALKVGGFDPDYFFNWEDGDFVSRLTLAGYICLNVPKAVVYHKGKARGTSKTFYMVRNRWYFIIKFYDWKTLILAAPMFFFFEISQALFLTLKGAGQDYWKGNLAVWEDLPMLLKKRREFKKLKIKADRDWLKSGDLYIPEGLIKGRVFKILKQIYNGFFGLYWQIIKPFC